MRLYTRAQRLLSEKVHYDRAGVHGTGIAVHNLVRGFAIMRSLFAYPNVPDPAAGEAVARSVFASTVVTDSVPIVDNAINEVINGSVLPVLIACGLLTLARMIRVGNQMSEDLAGTV